MLNKKRFFCALPFNIEKDANYVLAVKANQAQLLEHNKDEFRFGKTIKTWVNEELAY